VYPSALPLAMIATGLVEVTVESRPSLKAVVVGGLSTKGALAWTALKVGALSFGGGFVIVPIMRGDAVNVHHWMTASTFSTAVAIGQITPGPVVATVAAVGYAAAGWTGGVYAAAIAFLPSLLFVGVGATHFNNLRQRPPARAFLEGAGPAATGAIAASAIVLAKGCTFAWQWALLAAGAVVVVVLRRSPVIGLLGAAGVGLLLGAFTHIAV
jgi:chromate transporter